MLKKLFKLGAFLSLISVTSVFGLSYKDYFKAYDVQVIESRNVYTQYPEWAQPNPQQDNTDLDYWVNTVLPYEESRHADMYLVYPKHGIVTPVLVPNETDQALINSGQNFNHYKYLEQGALFYFGSAPNQSEAGNMVIAAHTSDKLSNPGKYKTIFQMLTISRAGDKIFLYIKNDTGLYDLYEYEVRESYETDKYDVSILKQNTQVQKLTTYGCYVIGSNKDRWVNEAYLTHYYADHSSLTQHEDDIELASAPQEEKQSVQVVQNQTYPVLDAFVDLLIENMDERPEFFRSVITYLNTSIDELTLSSEDNTQKLRLLHYIRDGVVYRLGVRSGGVISRSGK